MAWCVCVQSGDTEYSVDIEFMKPVDPEDAVRESSPCVTSWLPAQTPAPFRATSAERGRLPPALPPTPSRFLLTKISPFPRVPLSLAQDSKWAKTGRNLQMQIMKADKEEEEHWPRITKEKVKLQWLQTDWGRFVDEDEEDEKPADMGAHALAANAPTAPLFGLGADAGMPRLCARVCA
jgi:hypothetical protein